MSSAVCVGGGGPSLAEFVFLRILLAFTGLIKWEEPGNLVFCCNVRSVSKRDGNFYTKCSDNW